MHIMFCIFGKNENFQKHIEKLNEKVQGQSEVKNLKFLKGL